MNPVVKWIKGNVFIVIFSVIIVAAPISMWFVGGSMNESVRAEVSKRASRNSDLEKINKTNVAIINPVSGNIPINDTIVVNPGLNDKYRQWASKVGKDATLVHELAIQYNHKDRGVLLPAVFPAPPDNERETLPYEMHESFLAGMSELLKRIDAGMPPSSEDVSEDLASEQEQLENRTVADEDGEEKQKWLQEKLSEYRLSIYADSASSVGIYASFDSFPSLDLNKPIAVPQPAELYEWQWQYWIYEDILLALKAANNNSVSVLDAPVKHIVRAEIYRGPLDGASASTGNSGGGTGFSGRGSSKQNQPNENVIPAANPNVEVKLNYNESFTGRHSNPLYDVRTVTLSLVVETAKLTAVMDALAQRNFITVISSDIAPVDPFSALHAGYFYGAAPVSSVVLELETVWFRQWMSPFMHDDVRKTLGIPLQTIPSSS